MLMLGLRRLIEQKKHETLKAHAREKPFLILARASREPSERPQNRNLQQPIL